MLCCERDGELGNEMVVSRVEAGKRLCGEQSPRPVNPRAFRATRVRQQMSRHANRGITITIREYERNDNDDDDDSQHSEKGEDRASGTTIITRTQEAVGVAR